VPALVVPWGGVPPQTPPDACFVKINSGTDWGEIPPDPPEKTEKAFLTPAL